MGIHGHDGLEFAEHLATLVAGEAFGATGTLAVFESGDRLEHGLAALLAEHFDDAVGRQFVGFWHHRRERIVTVVPEPSADYITVTGEYQAHPGLSLGLPAPRCPLPLEDCDFRFEAGLRRLDAVPVHDARDQLAFQIDACWPAYREAKLAVRAEQFAKYVGFEPGQTALLRAVTAMLAERLGREYPRHFRYAASASADWVLHSRLSGAVIRSGDEPRSLVDALAMEVQEDVALMTLVEGEPRLTGLHVCFPNHWAPAEKLGGGFGAVHAAVPGMARLTRHPGRLHRALSQGHPWVRFAWGLATDTRLNHHPEPPPGSDAASWAGRRFDPAEPALWLRVERQVMLPVAGFQAYVFLIRTCFHAVADLAPEARQRLRRALATMDADTRAYKGLADSAEVILAWLEALD